MPNYIIQPEADHTADPDDSTNAVVALGVTAPDSVSGLTNGTPYVARQFVLSPTTVAFTPVSGITFIDTFSTYTDLDDIPTVSADWEYAVQDAGGSFTYRSANDVGSIETSSGSVAVNVTHTTAPSTDDQYAEFTYDSDNNGGTLNFAACINQQAGTRDRYEALYNETNDQLVLRLVTTGGNTTFGTNHALPAGGLVTGDIVRIERSGSALTVKLNNSSVITGTDSSLTGGKIGLACFFANGTRDIQISRFEGGDI